MLTYVFANQGWGSFGASLVTMAVLGCFKTAMDKHGQVYKVDAGKLVLTPDGSRY